MHPSRNPWLGGGGRLPRLQRGRDRKSTRLNSSHLVISYAVFCLKKKTDLIFVYVRVHHYAWACSHLRDDVKLPAHRLSRMLLATRTLCRHRKYAISDSCDLRIGD